MRFWLGLALGAVLGAVATWLVLARPWVTADAPPAIDAAPAEPAEAKPRPGGKKRRRKPGARDDAADVADTVAAPPVLTAADRAMVWRGPRIQLSGGTVDMGEASSGRPLGSSEIDPALERSAPAIVSCVEKSLAGAELRGQVRLEMLVSGDGTVRKVRVGAARWLIDHGLADCASRAARQIRFPATGADTIVDAPYHLD